MKDQARTIPSMKNGTAATYLEEREQKKKILASLEILKEEIEVQKMIAKDHELMFAIVEAPQEIIEYYNRGPLLSAFNRVGYFIINGAVVCKEGTSEAIADLLEESHSMDVTQFVAKHPEPFKEPVRKFKRKTTPPA